MTRVATVLAVLVGVVAAALMCLIPRDSSYAASDDVRLVVILASGWNSSGDLEGWQRDWAEVRAAMEELNEKGAPQSVFVQPFTYAPGRSHPYRACEDTNKSLRDSAAALTTQAASLLGQYRNARLLVVGHSLGGAVATYWLGDVVPDLPSGSATAERLKDATVVTLDSPVRGLDLAVLDRLLFSVQLVPGTQVQIGHELIRYFNCDSKIPDGLDQLKSDSIVAGMAKAATSKNLHNGASVEDAFIHFPEAILSNADSKLFHSGADCTPAMNATLLKAITFGIIDNGVVRKTVECIADTHSAVLRDRTARDWIKTIARRVRDDSAASPRVTVPEIPTEFEAFAPLVEKFARAMATHDVNLLRETLSSQPEFLAGNWGGAGTSLRVPISDSNLESLLASAARPDRIGKAIGAGTTLPCSSCQPAFGLVLTGVTGKTLFKDAFSGGGQSVPVAATSDEVMLVFLVQGRSDLPKGVFFGIVRTGPFLAPILTSPLQGGIERDVNAILAAASRSGGLPACENSASPARCVRVEGSDVGVGMARAWIVDGAGHGSFLMGLTGSGVWEYFGPWDAIGVPFAPGTAYTCRDASTREQPSQGANSLGVLKAGTTLKVGEFRLVQPGAGGAKGTGWFKLESSPGGWIAEADLNALGGFACQ